MDISGTNLMPHMEYVANMPQQIIDAMQFNVECIPNIIAWLLCMTFGYLMYTEAMNIIKKEGTDPYPLLLHCWMITIDTIGTITSWYLAITYNFFWIFVIFGIGLPIWVLMEARCIHAVITNQKERNRQFRNLAKGDVSEKDARKWAYGMIVASACLNMYAMDMIGGIPNAAVWVIWPLTNYVFPLWCWREFRARGVEEGTRDGASMRLHIILIIQISLMWIPGLSWYLGFTQFTHYPAYYVMGIAMSALCIYNAYQYSKLPAKRPRPDGQKPLW